MDDLFSNMLINLRLYSIPTNFLLQFINCLNTILKIYILFPTYHLYSDLLTTDNILFFNNKIKLNKTHCNHKSHEIIMGPYFFYWKFSTPDCQV